MTSQNTIRIRAYLHQLTQEQGHPPSHAKVILCQYSLAGSLFYDGHIQEALDYYLRVLDGHSKAAPATRCLSAVEIATLHQHMGVIHYAQDDYQKAVNSFRTALSICGRFLRQTDDEILKDLRHALDVAEADLREYSNCLEAFQRILLVLLQDNVYYNSSPRQRSMAVSLCRMAIQNYQGRDTKQALELVEESMAVVRDLLPDMTDIDDDDESSSDIHADQTEQTIAIASALHRASLLHSLIGSKEEAVRYLEESSRIYTRVQGYRDEDKSVTFGELGDSYFELERFDLALDAYENCIDALRDLGFSNEYYQTKGLHIHFNMSSIHFLNSDYESALRNCQEIIELYKYKQNATMEDSLTTSSELKSADKSLTAVIMMALSNMGTANLKLGAPSEALKCYEELLKFQLEKMGEKNLHVANTFFNIGLAHQCKGEFALAARAYDRAIDIREKLLGRSDGGIASVMNSKANACKSTGRSGHGEAMKYYLMSLMIRKSEAEQKPEETAIVLSNMGILCREVKDHDMAIECFEDALHHIKYNKGGQDHPCVGMALNGLGNVYLEKRDFTKARMYYEASLEAKKKTVGIRHKAAARTLINLGRLRRLDGEFSGALNAFTIALETWISAVAFEDIGTANLLVDIGKVHWFSKDYAKATYCFFETSKLLTLLDIAPSHKLWGEYMKYMAKCKHKLQKHGLQPIRCDSLDRFIPYRVASEALPMV